ncbi:9485_t:CDS:2 [Dentiscutata erythropus]|uniref:9485_t:CDS:1 n=1 Tax=Dentiscutata erythropus TaxID=1348616 RepID=A0A9N9NKU1_9GLOM|nr:9485_t:CDS:2 [Dentiscutata erythropus]
MDGSKEKGKGRFGFLDMFMVGGNELEGMDEEALLKIEYKYFSKDDGKYVRTTVCTILQNGIRQLTDSGIRCFGSWVSVNIVEANRWVSQHEHYKV